MRTKSRPVWQGREPKPLVKWVKVGVTPEDGFGKAGNFARISGGARI
jgi:hypothetical protein